MNNIFDIGANHGNFTGEMLRRYPTAQIITIEANPNLHFPLKNKFTTYSNVTVLDVAVAEKTGETIPFYLCAADTISTAEIDWVTKSRFQHERYNMTPIYVKTVSLDSLIDTYGIPDLIKIDVEGYELPVIKGLTKKAKNICFEWAEEQYDRINQSIEHLKSLGYEKFSFTYGDEYTKNLIYTSWEDCSIHNDINPNRKNLWGMIYVSE